MLLDAFGKKCVLIEKKRTGDGAGGYITEWVDGADFPEGGTRGRDLGVFRTGQPGRAH